MLTKMHLHKFDILIRRYAFKMQSKGTLIKGTVLTIEHIHQQTGFATGKNETGVRTMLYLRAQQSFHILFSIMAYLLKLIKRNNAGFIGSIQIRKDFIQSGIHRGHVS